MQKESILYGIIGLLAGSLITIVIASNAVNNNMTGMMRMMGMRQNQEMMMEHDEDMNMKGMVEALKGKTEDNFDKEFTNLMIEHHQGAIDMANLAKINAKHQEIKNLADDIISAQTNEIKMMQDWRASWGYFE